MAIADMSKLQDVVDSYHDLWGYFTFQQNVNFQYNQSGLYETKARFSIRGVLTPPSGVTDEEKYIAMESKLETLKNTLSTAVNSSAPSDISLYGTASDSRVIALPDPIRDSSNNIVYGKPLSLEIEETRWGVCIKYVASLEEIDQPPVKLIAGNIELDEAVITIISKEPRLSFQSYAFANGEEWFFSGWNRRSFNVSGRLPQVSPSGSLMSTDTVSVINDFSTGRITINKKVGNTETALFSDLFIEKSSLSIGKEYESTGYEISFSAKY